MSFLKNLNNENKDAIIDKIFYDELQERKEINDEE